jgi:uncharacterized BrkB/YihY/UPF0761 family membrane protein
MTLVTATIYYIAPDVDTSSSSGSPPGSCSSSRGFGVASAGFSMWVARFASYDKYVRVARCADHPAFWLYLLATFLLLGGELMRSSTSVARPAATIRRSA